MFIAALFTTAGKWKQGKTFKGKLLSYPLALEGQGGMSLFHYVRESTVASFTLTTLSLGFFTF